MKVYLAALGQLYKDVDWKGAYILTSFYELKKAKVLPEYVYEETHIADSGAFSTFKSVQEAKKMDWDDYVKRYINFVKETGNKLYFEMDIDVVVGLDKVHYYRKQMEDAIGYQSIPVWHSTRKWDYFLMMCETFPYVSLGTTKATRAGEMIRKNPAILDKFIKTAHSMGTKIHGLGFTSQPWLDVLNFDSVDSSTWLNAKYGVIFHFNGRHCKIVKKKNKDDKLIGICANYHRHNFDEWLKYQKWMLQK
jgi:hypothetical protein